MCMERTNNRQTNQMRPIEIEIGVNKHAEGSALVKFGDTHVIVQQPLKIVYLDGCVALMRVGLLLNMGCCQDPLTAE